MLNFTAQIRMYGLLDWPLQSLEDWARQKLNCVDMFSTDVDECLTMVAVDCPSNSHCVNTLGGFRCDCDKGYFQNRSSCCEYS